MEQNRREWNGGIKRIARRATKSPSRTQYPSIDNMKDTHSEQIETVCYCNNDNRNSNDYNSYTRDSDYSLDSCNEMN